MANSQYHAVRKRMQSPPTIPPAADRQNSQTPRSVRPDVQVLLTRPKASPSLANKGKGVKPEMKQTLQLVNKEILQRLKACRGLNRRQHPLIPSIKERQACVVSPIMEDPQDEMQGVGQLKDHGRSQSPPETVPEAAELSPHTLQGHWRQRLRSRAWRLPERPQGVQSVQSVQSAEPVVAASPTVPTRSSRVRGSRGSKEEARNGRARARERISLRRMSLEEFWAPFESGSAASSRRNSVQQESSHHGQARKSAAKRHGQAHSSRRGSANDRRHVSMRETDSDVEDADEDGDDVATGRLPDRTQPDRMHTLQALVEVETKEVELNFQVVKWSTQRQESPAADLEKQSGWWESANGVVENQFVIIQLANKEPKRLHALELNLPGNDAGPRFCKLQYSNESPDGPWKEAWSFQVVSKSDAGHVSCATRLQIQKKPPNWRQEIVDLAGSKDTFIVAYCAAGVRAQSAVDMLVQEGYTDVLNGGGYTTQLESVCRACAATTTTSQSNLGNAASTGTVNSTNDSTTILSTTSASSLTSSSMVMSAAGPNAAPLALLAIWAFLRHLWR